MWFAISLIVFASAIGFNVLALWLTDWFGENRPESPSYTERKTNSDLMADWARRPSTLC
jgi:hypothetical protein